MSDRQSELVKIAKDLGTSLEELIDIVFSHEQRLSKLEGFETKQEIKQSLKVEDLAMLRKQIEAISDEGRRERALYYWENLAAVLLGAAK